VTPEREDINEQVEEWLLTVAEWGNADPTRCLCESATCPVCAREAYPYYSGRCTA
jgi:hypothetical protein